MCSWFSQLKVSANGRFQPTHIPHATCFHESGQCSSPHQRACSLPISLPNKEKKLNVVAMVITRQFKVYCYTGKIWQASTDDTEQTNHETLRLQALSQHQFFTRKMTSLRSYLTPSWRCPLFIVTLKSP